MTGEGSGAVPVPSGGRVEGSLRVPSSKSVTHRYLNLALLAGEEVTLRRPLLAEDTELFLAALPACGVEVERIREGVRLVPVRCPAQPVPPGGPAQEIFCGNAGTMYRFLTASLASLPGRWRLDGMPRLRQRPVGPLVEALAAMGASIRHVGRPGRAPLEIQGGELAGGAVELDAGESSQYLSALLMASLRARGPVEIRALALTSAPYVEVTLEAVARFGGVARRLPDRRAGESRFEVLPGPLHGGAMEVEGDYSAAAYPAAAALLTGGRVELLGLRRRSSQGDRWLLELLGRMGAVIRWERDRLEVEGTGPLLDALDVDLSGMPDQVPTLAALAPFARGTTRIRGVPHLRLKESDRLAAMAGELTRLGARVRELPDGLEIPGVWADARPPETPVEVDPHGDHRIAMSLALAGLRRPGVTVLDAGTVAKSYPDFWLHLADLLEG